MIMLWAGVFFAFVMLDIAWTRYAKAAAAHRKWPAIGWSCTITLCSMGAVTEIANDNWLIVPAVLGTGLGTWVGMLRE